ncbi:hypothetical protein MalM25_28660 [Planctomycetes bacterium MalM25]|nr:hypothetical protein MalM25_28660 [Planctomycetes bacterium MalM25]
MIRRWNENKNVASHAFALAVLALVAAFTSKAVGQTDYDLTVDVGDPGDVYSFAQIPIPELVGVPYDGSRLSVNIRFAGDVSLVHSNLDGFGVGIRLGTGLNPGGSAQSFFTEGFISDANGGTARPADFVGGQMISSNGRLASYGLGFNPRIEPTEFFGLSLTFDLPIFDAQDFNAPNTTSATLRLLGADDANGIFTVTAIPEPTSLILLGLAGLLSLQRRSRRTLPSQTAVLERRHRAAC